MVGKKKGRNGGGKEVWRLEREGGMDGRRERRRGRVEGKDEGSTPIRDLTEM